MDKILLAHGAGGRLMHGLIKDLLLKKLGNPVLCELSDSAWLGFKEPLAFSTDSFVVNPIKFPGGDIGKLAVCGTVNDLVMLGARPEYLSLAFIIEEGLEYKALDEITNSISQAAKKSGTKIVTGDFKVVEKGAVDKIFINTSGVGRILKNKKFSVKNIKAGDKIIVTGNIGQHGLAVLAKRKDLDWKFNIKSDCAALNDLLLPVLAATNGVRFMRDPTRGGVATTLNEVAESVNLGIVINELDIPVSTQVRAASELLGIDPLYIANEGVALLIVSPHDEKKVLSLLRKNSLGKASRTIGFVTSKFKSRVILQTNFGTQRIIDMLNADPLPRIC